MNSARFAWLQLRREGLRGDLLLLVAAVAIAVAAAAAVSLFTDRVRAAMAAGGGEAIASDLRLELRDRLAPDRREAMQAAGLRVAETVEFASVGIQPGGENTALVSVKAVEPAYPLRGEVIISRDAEGSSGQTIGSGPPAGAVWVERRVLAELDLRLGDRLQLGESELEITARLIAEPDRGAGFLGLAPRVLMNLADVPATKLLQPGSRAEYNVLLAGEPDAVRGWRAETEPTLGRGESMESASEARPALQRALDRAEVFLDLSALIAVILAGIAIAMTAHQHALRRYDEIALIKSLGARRGFLGRMLAWQLVMLGSAGIVLGLSLGWTAQAVLSGIAARALSLELPGASPLSLWPALLTGAVILGGFAWPLLAAARNAPPLRVLQGSAAGDPATRALYPVAILSVVGLVAWQTGDLMLCLYVLGGGLLSAIVLWAAARLFLKGLGLLVDRALVPVGGWRQGVTALLRRPQQTSLLIVAFGIGLAVLFTLAIVRTDILASWEQSIDEDAPNRFLINIAPDQVDQVERYLREQMSRSPELYPMIRGRLTQRNGEALPNDKVDREEAGELMRRELNLSWQAELKNDNQVVTGQWFTGEDHGRALVSIDESVAERLNVGLGDSLGFDVAGETFSAEISSIRHIDWDSLQANFYLIFPPGFLDDYPTTWITSIKVEPADEAALSTLIRRFPNISTLDIQVILRQLEQVIDRVSLAVEFVFLFTLMAGALVLLAAIQTTRHERLREAAVMRALGARASLLRRAALAEFLGVGLLSALLATLCAQTLAVVLAVQLLDLDYQLRPLVWLLAIGLAAGSIATAGMLGIRGVLRQPALASLRD